MKDRFLNHLKECESKINDWLDQEHLRSIHAEAEDHALSVGHYLEHNDNFDRLVASYKASAPQRRRGSLLALPLTHKRLESHIKIWGFEPFPDRTSEQTYTHRKKHKMFLVPTTDASFNKEAEMLRLDVIEALQMLSELTFQDEQDAPDPSAYDDPLEAFHAELDYALSSSTNNVPQDHNKDMLNIELNGLPSPRGKTKDAEWYEFARAYPDFQRIYERFEIGWNYFKPRDEEETLTKRINSGRINIDSLSTMREMIRCDTEDFILIKLGIKRKQ